MAGMPGAEASKMPFIARIVRLLVSAKSVCHVTADGTVVGTLWQNNTATSLGLLPGNTTSFAESINNHGQVKGMRTQRLPVPCLHLAEQHDDRH